MKQGNTIFDRIRDTEDAKERGGKEMLRHGDKGSLK